MEWTKVKTNHALIEYSDFTEKQVGAWVLAMCLAAALEKMPTEAQLKKHIHGSTLTSLKNALSLHGVTLELVLSRVLDDCQYVSGLKETNRSKMAKWREKNKNVTSNVTSTEPDKRREDNIREDNIEYRKFESILVDAWNSFSANHPGVASVRTVSESRRKHIKARYAESEFRDNLESIIEKLNCADFLLGKNDRGWRVCFDWIISNDTNYVKVLEGRYAGEPKKKIRTLADD